MRRGSFKRRLPRGRYNRRSIHPALVGAALLLVLLVPAVFFLFLHTPASNPANPSISPEDVSLSNPDEASSNVLKVASSESTTQSGLAATVMPSEQGVTQVYLENSGRTSLERIKLLAESGKALGILSLLSPGEKKVLAMNGPVKGIKVTAIDPSGSDVLGEVRYAQPPSTSAADFGFAGGVGCAGDASGMGGAGGAGGSSEEEILSTKSAAEEAAQAASQATAQAAPPTDAQALPSTPAPASSPDAVEPVESPLPQNSGLNLSIAANRSEGREGDMVCYTCMAVNSGETELSDIKLFCDGKLASTKFLSPGKEIHLDGTLVINDSFLLEAGVQGMDPENKLWTNNTSIAIREISSQIKLGISAPQAVHRGEIFTMAVQVENVGNSPLHNITVSDDFGQVGEISLLQPGETESLERDATLDDSLKGEVAAQAFDGSGREVYAGEGLEINVLKSGLELTAQPSEVKVYPGQPAEVTWALSNTGEEMLRNITLFGEDGKKCMLKELPPGRSVRMAAVYTVECTSPLNVTAQGMDAGGYVTAAQGTALVSVIKPGIGLKVTPAQVEVCPGEEAEISCLITNTGDDDLRDISLLQQESVLATIDELAPGDFRVVDSRLIVSDNSTLQFEAQGKDSRGQVWSDSACARAHVVITALKVFASASPQSVVPGNCTNVSCTVANTGAIPLYSIFVISKSLGPLGTIDYLPPKRQKAIYAEKIVSDAVEDTISAEGFTQEKTSVRGSCHLGITVLNLPHMKENSSAKKEQIQRKATKGISVRSVHVRCGNMNIPLRLPEENETAARVSSDIAKAADSSAKRSGNQVMEGISGFLQYVQKILDRIGQKSESTSSQAQDISPQEDGDLSSARSYELSIEGVKGSEHGAIRVLDVSASPSQPAAWEQVKVSAHVKSANGVRAASARWGISDMPLTKQDMLGVDRIYETSMSLESGDENDGYWSCTIPGKAAGTYMVLSVSLTDGKSAADAGPYMLHWSTVNDAGSQQAKATGSAGSSVSSEGMLFIESSSVRGKGEVSIKDAFEGATMHFDEKMKGNGSISLESLRCIDKKSTDNFSERKDLVFTDGQLKGLQRVSSPSFHGGLGASVTERFNLSHVDKSESSSVSSTNLVNNTLAFNTDQAFDGTWNIQTQYAKFYKKIKADQQYTGSFQTQKKIKFQDNGQ